MSSEGQHATLPRRGGCHVGEKGVGSPQIGNCVLQGTPLLPSHIPEASEQVQQNGGETELGLECEECDLGRSQ